LGEVKSLYPSYGIVEDDLCELCDDIKSIVELVKNFFPELEKSL
jgi:hypothetical protein